MSIIFVLKGKVKAGKAAEFERLQTELTTVSRKNEPGMQVYEFARHRTEKDSYLVYARFVDEAAQQAHNVTPIHVKMVPPIMECFDGQVDVQFYDLIV